MQLTLQNGYPYPLPGNLSEVEQDEIAAQAGGITLTLDNVVAVQFLHTLTVELDSAEAFLIAKTRTGWRTWSNNVLEAVLGPDEYLLPGIIVGDTSFAGFVLH